MRLDESTDTRANLLAALSRSPELIASTRVDGPAFISVGVSPDGQVVGAGHAYGGVSFYGSSTRELLGTYDEVPVWKWEFSPDGQQLADQRTARREPRRRRSPQPSVRLIDAATFDEAPVQLGGLPESAFVSAPHYSADGRFLGVTFEGSDGGADTSVVVWDLTSPDRPVLRFDVPGFGYELDAEPRRQPGLCRSRRSTRGDRL